MADKYAASGGNITATTHSTSYDYISPLELDLSGKNTLITGVAYRDGVGYATATAFARAGASIIALADLQPIASDLIADLKAAASQAGRKEPVVLPFTVDISSPSSVQELHESVKQALDNRLDILVNNAAYSEPTKPLLNSDPDVYWRTWEVNVHGLFNIPDAVRAVLRDHPSIAGDTIAWLASERREWLGGRYVSCPWDMEELVAKREEIVEQDKLKLRMVF